MFTNRSANETNVRVVFYGLGLAGKTTLMQRIYDDTPAEQKGKMVSVQADGDRTVFFDLQRPEFGEVQGARLRLHLHTLSGRVHYAESRKLLLRNVDAVVFVADAQAARQEANVASYEELQANLSEQGRIPSTVPQILCVTKCDLATAEHPDLVVSGLASGTGRGLRVDGRTGEGLAELMTEVVRKLRHGIVEGQVKEWQPSPEEEQSGREFTARARLVGHYGEHFGETAREYTPASPIDGRPGFIVVEHGPNSDRPFWTYATAGVSLWEQRPGGAERRVEFLAYSPRESQAVVDVLMVLARQIHLLDEADTPYKTFDTVTLPGVELVHEMFVLAPPMEGDELLAFPDLANRTKDARFTHAITGNLEDSVDVAFIHVLPVLPDELEFATKSGTRALLEKMDLAKRGKDFGWGRKKRASVLRRGLFGLFS